MTPTGLYPQHFAGFLSLIGAAPNRRAIADGIKIFYSDELEHMVGESGMIMGIHRTADEWPAHPQGKHLTTVPLIEIVKISDSEPAQWAPAPNCPLFSNQGTGLYGCYRQLHCRENARRLLW